MRCAPTGIERAFTNELDSVAKLILETLWHGNAEELEAAA
jgi:hypothetical protein